MKRFLYLTGLYMVILVGTGVGISAICLMITCAIEAASNKLWPVVALIGAVVALIVGFTLISASEFIKEPTEEKTDKP